MVAGVSNRHQPVTGNFPLDADVPLLYAQRREIRSVSQAGNVRIEHDLLAWAVAYFTQRFGAWKRIAARVVCPWVRGAGGRQKINAPSKRLVNRELPTFIRPFPLI